MDNDDELEQIRRRKMMDMERSMSQEREVEEQKRYQEAEKARKQQILRQILAPDARERLANVRLVRPDLAENVENQLIQLASMGRINRLINDSDVRDILGRLTESKRETKIERR